MNDFRNMWDFDVMENIDFPNCNRVHPLMQRRVQRLLEILKQDENIDRVVIFGSALEFRCSSYSDLDVYIEKKNPDLPLREEPELDCEVDIITNPGFGSRLYQEIDRTGLLVFGREEEACAT